MDGAITIDDSRSALSDSLRRALANSDAKLAGINPILGHLLTAPDHSLFSDEIVARVRGMCSDLARQILREQAQAAGHKDREAFADNHGDALAAHFQASPALLRHCHALAIEWQVTERLEADAGLDPVLSPALQQLMARTDDRVSGAAMATLAAQARFSQNQRRMELPLVELPADLLHSTLLAWRRYCGDGQRGAIDRADDRIRSLYDEGACRLSWLARIIFVEPSSHRAALNLEDAGAGLFFSGLALFSGQPRELAVLSSHAGQTVRLALGLRASGAEPDDIDEILLRLHPNATPIAGLATIGIDDARTMLSVSNQRTNRS